MENVPVALFVGVPVRSPVGDNANPAGSDCDVNEITARPDSVVALYWSGVIALFCTAVSADPLNVKVSAMTARSRVVDPVAGEPDAVA
jgi:hypothetical protein